MLGSRYCSGNILLYRENLSVLQPTVLNFAGSLLRSEKAFAKPFPGSFLGGSFSSAVSFSLACSSAVCPCSVTAPHQSFPRGPRKEPPDAVLTCAQVKSFAVSATASATFAAFILLCYDGVSITRG